MPSADDLFRAELDSRGLAYSIMDDGCYEVRLGDQAVTVSLENIRRNYDRDGDADAAVRFVDQVAAARFGDTPPWNEVRPYVRYSLEPSDYETGFGGVLFKTINNNLNQVFVYTSADASKIIWIHESMLEDWGATREQVFQQAEENMTTIAANARLEVKDVGGNPLGMISTEETPFKAALILSPAFRELVSPTHGWPVYAVVPCRDFAYVIRDDNREFLGRLGRVVVDEYRNSGYPITKDVLRVSDDGIIPIGTYPEPE